MAYACAHMLRHVRGARHSGTVLLPCLHVSNSGCLVCFRPGATHDVSANSAGPYKRNHSPVAASRAGGGYPYASQPAEGARYAMPPLPQAPYDAFIHAGHHYQVLASYSRRVRTVSRSTRGEYVQCLVVLVHYSSSVDACCDILLE